MNKSFTASDPVRRAILDAIRLAPSDVNLKSLSYTLGRNHAYLHQFIYKGSPKVLPENLRHILARTLNIHEKKLRPLELKLAPNSDLAEPNLSDHIEIQQLDHPSQKNDMASSWLMPKSFLGHIADKSSLKWLKLDQTLSGLHAFIIDTADRSALHSGEFVLDMGANIRVSYLEQISPKTDQIHVSSAQDSPYITSLNDIVILGRVVFKGSIHP